MYVHTREWGSSPGFDGVNVLLLLYCFRQLVGKAILSTGRSTKGGDEKDVDELVDPLPGKLHKTVVGVSEIRQCQ